MVPKKFPWAPGKEALERQITAELNRKQLMPQQIAAVDPPAQAPEIAQPPMTEQQPMPQPAEMPAIAPSEEAPAAATPADPADEEADPAN